MTFRFSKKEILILVLTFLLVAVIIFAAYNFYISPKKQDIDTKTSTLKSEQQVLATLKQQQNKKTNLTVESIAALQRKVPVKPQLEQLILDLEKAEIVSGSQIKNMSFSEGDVQGEAPAAPPQQQQPAEGEKTEENADSNKESDAQKDNASTEQTNQQNNANGGQAAQPNQPAAPAPYEPTPLPAGIKKLAVTLSVVSSDYDELKSFIETLEALPRTLVVESVGFSSGGEITSLDSALEEEKELSYTITLSAFYMPVLTDLQDQLPEIVPPAPGNKTYPFNKFPDLSASGVSN